MEIKLTQCPSHIETSELIFSANQLTGFYMRGTLVVKGLNQSKLAESGNFFWFSLFKNELGKFIPNFTYEHMISSTKLQIYKFTPVRN